MTRVHNFPHPDEAHALQHGVYPKLHVAAVCELMKFKIRE